MQVYANSNLDLSTFQFKYYLFLTNWVRKAGVYCNTWGSIFLWYITMPATESFEYNEFISIFTWLDFTALHIIYIMSLADLWHVVVQKTARLAADRVVVEGEPGDTEGQVSLHKLHELKDLVVLSVQGFDADAKARCGKVTRAVVDAADLHPVPDVFRAGRLQDGHGSGDRAC